MKLPQDPHWLHAVLVFTAYRIWAYWLKRTEMIAANSTAELLSWGFKRLFQRRKQMESAEQQLAGGAIKVDETYGAGVASVVGVAALPPTAFGLSLELQAKANLDAKILIGYLAAKVGGPVPAEVAAFLQMALASS